MIKYYPKNVKKKKVPLIMIFMPRYAREATYHAPMCKKLRALPTLLTKFNTHTVVHLGKVL